MQVRKFCLIALTVVGLLVFVLPDGARPVAAQAQPPSHRASIAAAAPPSPGVQGPFIGAPIPASSFDGDVRQLPKPRQPAQSREAPPVLHLHAANAPAPSTTLDSVRQTQMGTRQSPTPLQNFAGLSFDGWYPPDTNGDVGPNNYIQAVNIAIGIYSKTGTLQASFSFDSLFSSNGGTGTPCDNSNYGDPIALYDATVDRWLVADFAWSNSNGPFYECIAFSKTVNPVSGGWYLYAMLSGNSLFPDYPKFGVWSDGYYMSANLFNSSNYSQGARVWALNRSDMLSGASLHAVYFDVSSNYAGLLPGNLRGSTPPPSGEPAFFGSIDQNTNTFHLWKFQANWSTSTFNFTGPQDLTVASFTMPCNVANISACVPELNGQSVDSLGDRLMMQLQYRNISGIESLWVNHTIAASSNTGYPTGIRWYEIRNPNGSPYVYQQGTFQPDSNYRWMGSLAVDKNGDMALGYSVSSASMYPAIRYAGRLVSDPLGQLCFAETSLIEGTGAQLYGSNRWGDYSAMTIDPVDDLTFWYTNEYYATTGGGWQTRIGSFQLATGPTGGSGPYTYYFPLIALSAPPTCY